MNDVREAAKQLKDRLCDLRFDPCEISSESTTQDCLYEIENFAHEQRAAALEEFVVAYNKLSEYLERAKAKQTRKDK